MDSVQNRLAGGFDVDDDAIAYALRYLMTNTDYTRRAIVKLGHEASDFGGADIDGGDHAGTGTQIDFAHALGLVGRPFLINVFAASGGRRSTRRSSSRISTAVISRSRTLSLRSSAASRCQAAAGDSSGNATSTPLSNCSVHRRSPMR